MFGFKVEKLLGGWVVSLPHRCGTWDITEYDEHPSSKEEAIASLEAFIAEGQQALAALKQGEEYDAGH
jgi:hypothetical protein